MLVTVEALESRRRQLNNETRGRSAQEEVDILRSAIVFTSSGLDASMKRLVGDAGRYLIAHQGNPAREAYERQMKQWLTSDVDENLRAVVASTDPTSALASYYLSMKTSASFQGSGDLRTRVKNTIGISNASVSDASLQSLDNFFIARNSIVHSMDYLNINVSTGRARIHRTRDEVRTMCNGVFDVAAKLIIGAAVVLRSAGA